MSDKVYSTRELLRSFLEAKDAAEIAATPKLLGLSDYISEVRFKPGLAIAFLHLRHKASADEANELINLLGSCGVNAQWDHKRDRLMIQMTDQLAASIEDYRLDHGHRSTNDAVLALIKQGLQA